MARRGSYRWAVAHYGKSCNRAVIASMDVQPGVTIWVDRRTFPVWRAIGKIMDRYGYVLRPGDTGAYNCRPTTGGKTPSRHAHGLASDFNWQSNPYIKTPTLRPIRWGVDTDMPAAMVAEIESITCDGHQAVTWGGRWRTVKDAMHFQIHVTPTEIKTGVHVPGGIIIEPEGDDMTLTRGDTGNTVGLYQTAIDRWASTNNIDITLNGEPFVVDESYGPHTEHVVRIYQSAANLPTTGDIDGITAANLVRYVSVIDGGPPQAHTHPPTPHEHHIPASTTGTP